jgi:large subunit ribosomal protein L30
VNKVGLILVVNLHGMINSSAPVRKALNELWVAKKFSASVVPDDAATVGMLKLCKDYVAWTPVEEDLLSDLLKKRGRVSASRALDAGSLKELGYKKHEDLAAKMMEGQMRLSAVKGVLPYFRLAPPKGGFRMSLRRQSTERGLLGNNPRLEEIVRRMI